MKLATFLTKNSIFDKGLAPNNSVLPSSKLTKLLVPIITALVWMLYVSTDIWPNQEPPIFLNLLALYAFVFFSICGFPALILCAIAEVYKKKYEELKWSVISLIANTFILILFIVTVETQK